MCNGVCRFGIVLRIGQTRSSTNSLTLTTSRWAYCPYQVSVPLMAGRYGDMRNAFDHLEICFDELSTCLATTHGIKACGVGDGWCLCFIRVARAGAYHSLMRLKSYCDLVVVTSRQHVIKQPTLEWINLHFPNVFQEVHFGNHWAKEGKSTPKSEICRWVSNMLRLHQLSSPRSSTNR